MQRNSLHNRAVPEPATSLVSYATPDAPAPEMVNGKEVYRRDPYTISEDGHHVGMDGFVVPKSFAEFYERYPQHVQQWVRRRTKGFSVEEFIREEYVSELIVHLLTVPEDSIFRVPGTNGHAEGCTDRIQTFRPDRSYGCSAPRFFHWLNHILSNQFIVMAKKRRNDPMYCTVDTTNFTSEEEGTEFNEDAIYGTCNPNLRGSVYEGGAKAAPDTVLVAQFRAFLCVNHAELVTVHDALDFYPSLKAAKDALCLEDHLFARARSRLKVHYESFVAGEALPRFRRAYQVAV